MPTFNNITSIKTSKNVASPPKILLSVEIRHTGCAKIRLIPMASYIS